MKDLSVWVVALSVAVAVFFYCRKIYRKEAEPALSTWLIFFTATFLSFLSYCFSENWDWKSGIMNFSDTAGDFIVLGFIVAVGDKSKKRLKPFEKKYLAGAAFIVLFWIFSQNAFTANLLLQLLLIIGYFPTIQNMISEKKNTEPMAGWAIIFIAALFALYPAIVEGNALAVIYAGRAITMLSIVLSLMVYYEIKNSKGASV